MRRPSRLTSTICGAPFNGVLGCFGCAALRTIPPRCTDPVFRGRKGSETSYCKNSPVPKQETYKKRSSRDRLMSVISGGTALKPCNSGGNVDYFLNSPFAIVAMPDPNRRREIFQRDYHSEKTVSSGGIVSRPQLQRHLIFGT